MGLSEKQRVTCSALYKRKPSSHTEHGIFYKDTHKFKGRTEQITMTTFGELWDWYWGEGMKGKMNKQLSSEWCAMH